MNAQTPYYLAVTREEADQILVQRAVRKVGYPHHLRNDGFHYFWCFGAQEDEHARPTLQEAVDEFLRVYMSADEAGHKDTYDKPKKRPEIIEAEEVEAANKREQELEPYSKLAEKLGAELDGGEERSYDHPGTPASITFTDSQFFDFVRALGWPTIPSANA